MLAYGCTQAKGYIAFPIYGQSLKELVNKRENKLFSIKTVAMIGLQIINQSTFNLIASSFKIDPQSWTAAL